MSELGKLIRSNRGDLSLRSMSDLFRSSIGTWSPIHLSRMENDMSGKESSKIEFERLWSMGVKFGISPLVLLLMSRFNISEAEAKQLYRDQSFAVTSLPNRWALGDYMRHRRVEMGKKSVVSLIAAAKEKSLGIGGISSSFWSQLEHGYPGKADHISGDTCWFIGLALSVDPCLLFVLSRRDITDRYLDAEFRSNQFSRA